MILYQLRCKNDHTFEAWFKDSAAYDKQAKRGHVECPYCGNTKVTKAPMAPRIAKSSAGKDEGQARDTETDITFMNTARANEIAREILEAVGKIRAYAEENFEDVGDQFAEEARKIHYGEAEARGIYGRASDEEARELEEEGVEFVRLPGVPRRNG